MSATAAVRLRRQGAPDLLIAYADAIAQLPTGPDCKRLRRNAVKSLLSMHPHLSVWMSRQTWTRLADVKRTGRWPFLTWCFVEGHLARHRPAPVQDARRPLRAVDLARHREDV